MKKENNKSIAKTIKITTIVLLIILISMISFFGIYIQSKNKMSNSVKGYTYGMDINGARSIKLQLNTETKQIIKDSEGNEIEKATDEEIEQNGYVKEEVPNNKEEVKTEDNYKKSKEVIERRLKLLGVQNYNIALNKENGEINIEIPEDLNTDNVISKLNTIGKFEIIDNQTKEILLNNNHVKSSDVLYNTSSTDTGVYLEIAFNKDGKKKLEEISKTYVKDENNTTSSETTTNVSADTENTNLEQDTSTQASNEKKITMKIDDKEIMTTNFDEPITTGKIQLSVGTPTSEASTLQDYIEQAQNVATVLDSGDLPIKYNIEKNQYILSDITEQELGYIVIAVAIVSVIGIAILIFKYRINGLLAGFSYVGLVALYMLLVRYANVIISIESIFGIINMLILDYIFTFMLLNNINANIKEQREDIVNKATTATYIKFFNKIIPICIMVIAFCFVKWIPISSFGMIGFWGLVIIAVYNTVITKTLLKINIEDDK